MALNRYKGICFICGQNVPPRKGDFQNISTLPKSIRKKYTGVNYKGSWLVRCFGCKGLGNISRIDNDWLKDLQREVAQTP